MILKFYQKVARFFGDNCWDSFVVSKILAKKYWFSNKTPLFPPKFGEKRQK
jgi:hypothetical protein